MFADRIAFFVSPFEEDGLINASLILLDMLGEIEITIEGIEFESSGNNQKTETFLRLPNKPDKKNREERF